MEYNPNTPHQGGTKAFKDLTYKEQALSINGSIANLEKAIRYHGHFGGVEAGREELEILAKCVGQVEGLLERLRSDLQQKAIPSDLS
jgi:hypothetical protein